MDKAPKSKLTVLVVNCGSSSIKFAWVEPVSGEQKAVGLAEKLGAGDASLKIRARGREFRSGRAAGDHSQAMAAILAELKEIFGTDFQVDAIGHRVVHGGEYFREATRIDEEVIRKIERCSVLAPLHNPAHVIGIRAALEYFPSLPQAAVFDTAYHQTMAPRAFLYGIPHEIYQTHAVRRYGAHGSSHGYVSAEAARFFGKKKEEVSLLVAHLGNGCSVCAVREGISADTSMGLTPLEGLMMGTRSGNVDPSLHLFLQEQCGWSLAETTDFLNRKCGLLGVSGLSNDMRTLTEAMVGGHERARLAVELFCYRLAKGLMEMAAALDSLDAIVFTGGIGENSASVRSMTLEHLKLLRPALDPKRNEENGKKTGGKISVDSGSGPEILVIPTNEELMIARSTAEVCWPGVPAFTAK